MDSTKPVYKPFCGARCVQCKGIIVYYRGTRRRLHDANTCSCPKGSEEPGEPFEGQTPKCDCGVSMGLRSDHEGECSMAYLRIPPE